MFKLSVVIVSALFSSSVFALGGVGDVVTDPTSYSYYAKQVEAAQKQYEQATEHLNTAIETKNKVLDVQRQLEGNYNRAMRHIKKFQKWKENIKDDPLQFAEDTIQNRDAVLDYTGKVERSIDSYYYGEDLFNEEGKRRSGWVNIERGKREQQQLAFKRAAVKAEVARGMIEVDLDELEELATEVNSTTSLKDSADVNSSILLKLLESSQRTNALLADISTTLALSNYGGEAALDKSQFDKFLDDEAFEPDYDKSSYDKVGHGFKMFDSDGCNPFAGGC